MLMRPILRGGRGGVIAAAVISRGLQRCFVVSIRGPCSALRAAP